MRFSHFSKLSTVVTSLSIATLTLTPVFGSETSALVPNQWVYSKSKILTHFYKCTSTKCNKSSLVSYHFQDVTDVSLAEFKSGISSIAENFKNLGYKYKLIGKAEKINAPDGVDYAIYLQKSALTDHDGDTIQQVSGLIVGRKISLSIDSTSDDMAPAQTNFVNFASLLAQTLNEYENSFSSKKPKKCIKSKMIPVCFGPT